MPALSNKDKLRLKVAAKRLEKAKLDSLKPWVRKKPVGSTILCLGQEKPAVSYDDKDVIESPDMVVRSMSGKLGRHGNAIAARVHTIEHVNRETGEVTTQIVYDCPQNDGPATTPLHLVNAPKFAKARKNSPFKRAKASALSVVIERKPL